MKLNGREAIEWAEKGFKLNKYGDPIEGPLENISVEYAEEVSREDPSLIWCEVPDSTYAGAKLGSIVTATKSAAARENGKRGGRPAPEYTYAAAYGDSIVYLSADFDLG